MGALVWITKRQMKVGLNLFLLMPVKVRLMCLPTHLPWHPHKGYRNTQMHSPACGKQHWSCTEVSAYHRQITDLLFVVCGYEKSVSYQ